MSAEATQELRASAEFRIMQAGKSQKSQKSSTKLVINGRISQLSQVTEPEMMLRMGTVKEK